VIPPFNESGCLPEGIYDCTIDEAAERFGGFQGSSQRPHLWDRFIEFMREADTCKLVHAVLVDGSFVTTKADPNDIDLVLVVPANHDFSADFQPSEYNVLSKRRVNRRFGLAQLSQPEGSKDQKSQ